MQIKNRDILTKVIEVTEITEAMDMAKAIATVIREAVDVEIVIIELAKILRHS